MNMPIITYYNIVIHLPGKIQLNFERRHSRDERRRQKQKFCHTKISIKLTSRHRLPEVFTLEKDLAFTKRKNRFVEQ